MKPPTIEVRLQGRPKPLEPWANLVVNERHIWRFETETQAVLAAANLKLVFGLSGPVTVKVGH